MSVLDWGLLLAVSVAGADRTDDLVGPGEIDRELDAAGIAVFRLVRSSAKPTANQAVVISGICASDYVGIVRHVAYDPQLQAWRVECTDALKAFFHDLRTPAALLALLPAGAIWHRSLHGEWPADGWEAAQDAMGTIPHSIYVDAGELASVPWAGTGYTDTVAHSAGDIYDDSVGLDEPEVEDLIASVEMTVEVRCSRWHEWTIDCGWAYPEWDFCEYMAASFTLPTRQMIEQAITSNAWSLKEPSGLSAPGGNGIVMEGLPESGVYCGSVWNLVGGLTDQGFVWYDGNIQGTPQESIHQASWSMRRRWSQTLRGTWTMTVQATPGTPGGARTDQASYDPPADDSGFDASSAGRSATGGIGTWQSATAHRWADQILETERDVVLAGALGLAATTLRRSHRQRILTATVEPGAEPALGARVLATPELMSAQCQVVALHTTWDSDSHAAGCAISLAVTSGSTAADPGTLPADPDLSPSEAGYSLSGSLALQTHIGGWSTDDPPQSDSWDGWVGMAKQPGPIEGSQTYAEGFALRTPDVPAEARDEQAATTSATYTIDPLAGSLTIG